MIESLKSGLWLTPERLRTYPILLFVMLGCGIAFLIATAHDGHDWMGRPLGPDFSEIWAAGQEVREGQPDRVYDIEAHRQKQAELFGASPDFYMWSYPPYFLAAAGLLAALPYLAALLIWQATTLSLYLTAVLTILRSAGFSRARVLIPVLAFPAVFINLAHGQNGFLTAALLTGGLLNLRARPILAGALFACVAYKPQFAVMIPIALLAGGYWRCILSGVATLSLLTLATLALFGTQVWMDFPDGIKAAKSLVLEHGGAGFEKMQSLFATVRLLGGTIHQAYLVQGMAIILLIAGLAWLWRSASDFRLKSAALLTAALLATPYSFDYDMVLLGPALAFALSYGCEKGFEPYEKTLFSLVWISPLLARPLATAAHIPIGAFLMVLFFLAVLHWAWRGTALSASTALAISHTRSC
jgi:hypothetical protein